MDTFVIIDGNSLLNRAFYALPMLANFQGEISNAVFGFTNILTKIINDYKPKYIAVAFDVSRDTFRRKMYSEYKGNRKETPHELKSQFPLLKELLGYMNIKYIEQEGIEADDIIGTLTKKFDTHNYIVTGDRDSLQLINNNTTVLFTKKGISEVVVYDAPQLYKDYQLKPSQIVDLKALMGDASDNIPGATKVGEKTALSLLEKYTDIDGLYKHADEITGKLGETLRAEKDLVYLCKQLATIKTDCDIDVKLQDFEYEYPFNDKVLEMCQRLQFNSILKRKELFKGEEQPQSAKLDIVKTDINNIEDLNNLVKLLSKQNTVSLYLEDNLYISFGDNEYVIHFDGDLFTAKLNEADTFAALQQILENNKITKILFDIKAFKHRLHQYNIKCAGNNFDLCLARYLINSNYKSATTLNQLISENNLDNNYMASNMFALKDIYAKQLDEQQLNDLYYNIEIPLIDVLFDMEICGFKVDKQAIKELDVKYSFELEQLTQEIYSLAGKKFNINSPKQLAEILFDDLGINIANNKKRSTKVDILELLAEYHPIVPKILRYRQVFKLYTTYVKAFEELMDKNTNKIYTVFNQTGTATGRLSSSEPNLQNIPVRSTDGKELRKIFIPSSPDGYILSADYNQIELRLLANFSKDAKLIEAYQQNEDIHALTASHIFGVKLQDVTPELRRNAKAINFGIIYGISDYGLSQNIGSTRKTAAEFIKLYFEKYPKVKQYMDDNVEYANQNGYVKTYFNRRRYIPEINSSNRNLRQFGERVAMNMPLQGTASDVIKLAMIKVYNDIKKQNLKSKLILQVHDELIIDVHKDELDQIATLVRQDMEGVVDFKVKLPVSVSYGKNLYEAK